MLKSPVEIYRYHIVYTNIHGNAAWDFGTLDQLLREHSPSFAKRVQAMNVSWPHDISSIAKDLGIWLTEVIQAGIGLPEGQCTPPTARFSDRVHVMAVQVGTLYDGQYAIVWPEEVLGDYPKQVSLKAEELVGLLRSCDLPNPVLAESLLLFLGRQPSRVATVNEYRDMLKLLRAELDLAIGRAEEGIW